MGRRRDNPDDQREKGYPGRRRGQTDRTIAATAARKRMTKAERLVSEAEARARAFAAAPAETSDGLAAPAFMADPLYADVLAIWRHYAPLLDMRNFYGPEFRELFAAFCVYAAEFRAADAEVRAKGYAIIGRATNGGKRPWSNPAVGVRDTAFDNLLKLSSKFGFTPLDLAALERETAAASGTGDWGPLGRSRKPQPDEGRPVPDATAPAEDDSIGALAAYSSPPPGAKPN